MLLAIQQLLCLRRAMYNQGFIFLVFIYSLWCITTTFWSEVYELSLYKSIMFFVMAFTMLYAGQNWVTRQGVGKCFDYLIPTAVAAYAAAFLGYFFSPIPDIDGLFQGFAHGPNMLGALMAFSAPLVIWRLYSNWKVSRRRNGWMLSSGAGLLFLLMSQSRSSILVVLFILGGYLFSLTTKKLIIFTYLVVLVLAVGSVLLPDTRTRIVQHVVYKNRPDAIIFSRIQPWTESYQKAELGGWVGGGYGVSIGSNAWEGGTFTSVGYGREKGNAQMAIVEETGVVGLALYIMMLFSLFSALISRYRTIADKDIKAALGIFMGALAGMVIQSAFEAWWVAPGSPESPIFWTLAGAALGIADLGREHALRRSGPAFGQHQS